jgi:AbrB family looped-hinge helix DNA binding protein
LERKQINLCGNMPVTRESLTDAVRILENLFKTSLDGRGRLYLPKEVRDRLSIKEGDKIYIKVENNSLALYTTKMIQKELKKTPSISTP